MATDKVRSAGRFGSRYGVGIRKRLLKVEDRQLKPQTCPFCHFKKVKRKSTGIFVCKKCGAKFAGGAYLPQTTTGSIIKKMVTQKSFTPMETELVEAKEEAMGQRSIKDEIKEEAIKELEEEKKAKKEKASEKPAKEKPTKKKAVKKEDKEEKAEKKGAKEKKVKKEPKKKKE